jgi:opacity protein-like surface antigen
MKCSTFLMLAGLGLAALPALSQTQPGSWELSVAGNGGSLSTSTETSGGPYFNYSDEESFSYLALDFRAGIFVAEGFSIEPECYFLALEEEPPVFNLGANLAYTFTIPESRVKPFVIAGYGIGNGVPVMQRLISRESDKLDIPVVRVGGGLKIFFTDQVAFKVEYRYEHYSYERSSSSYGYSYTYKHEENYNNILFGFSVFLPAAQ